MLMIIDNEPMQVWKVIIPVDIGCDKIQNMWENDVVRRIIKHRMEGVVCVYCSFLKLCYTT